MSGADTKLGKPTRMHLHLPSYAQEEYITNRELARELHFKLHGETLSIAEIMLKGLKCYCDVLLQGKDNPAVSSSIYKYNRIKS